MAGSTQLLRLITWSAFLVSLLKMKKSPGFCPDQAWIINCLPSRVLEVMNTASPPNAASRLRYRRASAELSSKKRVRGVSPRNSAPTGIAVPGRTITLLGSTCGSRSTVARLPDCGSHDTMALGP
ncbi:hypothetical protein D3C72_1704140 [compost metagenome]